jgi:hypothetical protein
VGKADAVVGSQAAVREPEVSADECATGGSAKADVEELALVGEAEAGAEEHALVDDLEVGASEHTTVVAAVVGAEDDAVGETVEHVAVHDSQSRSCRWRCTRSPQHRRRAFGQRQAA